MQIMCHLDDETKNSDSNSNNDDEEQETNVNAVQVYNTGYNRCIF